MGCACAKKKKYDSNGMIFGEGGSIRMSMVDRKATVEGKNPLVIKIHAHSDFDAVLKKATISGKIVVAYFYTIWCGPCLLLTSKVDQFADEFVSQALFVKINVDDNDELASYYGISCMPTFIIFVKGEKVEEISGANVDKLKQLIVKNIEKYCW